MFEAIKKKLIYNTRTRAYDESPRVEWVDATMYDLEAIVDAYDPESDRKLSTLNSLIELEFLDLIERQNIKTVIDIGCGAGAFYHLLRSASPETKYFGYDLSRVQIARARGRFGDMFKAKDASEIEQAEFAKYDAIHAYSVFSFMSVAKQLTTIRRMLRSGAKVLIETGVTLPDIRYMPPSCFKDFAKVEQDGKRLMTTVSFPFKRDLDMIVKGTGHKVTYTERDYMTTKAMNASGKAGGALASKPKASDYQKSFEKKVPFQTKSKILWAKISPQDWTPSREYEISEIDAILGWGQDSHKRK
jgi:SAM-dependent methyltransferase